MLDISEVENECKTVIFKSTHERLIYALVIDESHEC